MDFNTSRVNTVKRDTMDFNTSSAGKIKQGGFCCGELHWPFVGSLTSSQDDDTWYIKNTSLSDATLGTSAGTDTVPAASNWLGAGGEFVAPYDLQLCGLTVVGRKQSAGSDDATNRLWMGFGDLRTLQAENVNITNSNIVMTTSLVVTYTSPDGGKTRYFDFDDESKGAVVVPKGALVVIALSSDDSDQTQYLNALYTFKRA